MTENFKKFVAVYTRVLEEKQSTCDPDYTYAFSKHTPAQLAEKMTQSLLNGTANKEGVAIKQVLKELRIKNTYKAIKEFLSTST